ncbi:MAG: hemin receptor [Proteobacteria bacterium]|nr:hemin receptor [Pseudomonadota bacterium]
MTRHQINLIRQTLIRLGRDRARLGGWVYARLFALDPSLRALFPGDMEKHGANLSIAIDTVVRALDNLTPLLGSLRDLGARHARYGATPAHFALVEQALLQALGDELGRMFTSEYRAAWATAYRTLADVMMAAADESKAA